MSDADRRRWDTRYRTSDGGRHGGAEPGPPAAFEAAVGRFPTTGRALDIACGAGAVSVWLAQRGMSVHGVDVSPVAIEMACSLAVRCGVADRCRFEVADLDDGLPDGPPVELVICNMFRGRGLDAAMIERVAPGGLLAVARLSEVGAAPGCFRAEPGELHRAFGHLDVLDDGEADGRAWLLARKRP